MINTIDDFMKRFGSQETVNDEEAVQLHDLFVSSRPEHSQFDNRTYQHAATEYLGKLPDDQFRDAAQNAVAQVPQQERQDLLGTLLGAMQGGSAGGGAGAAAPAGGLGGIARMLGLSSTDPNKMTQDDATRVIDYARKENPDALRQTVQEKPWFVKAMGNPVVMGALTLAAAKLLTNLKNKA
jgi:hypothetical protein